MAVFRFDRDIAADSADAADGVTRRSLCLHDEWNVGSGILNGGYLQAVAVRAGLDTAGEGHRPVAVSTTFAAAARPGPAEVEVTVLRRGRRIVALSTTMRQAGEAVLTSLVTVGTGEVLGDIGEATHTSETAPEIAAPSPSAAPSPLAMPPAPPPADCIRVAPDAIPGSPGLAQLIDYAFVPEHSGWLQRRGAGTPHLQCWLAFADDRPVDALAVCALMDMAPPVSFAQGRFGWAPTLQLQVGICGVPSGGPVLLDLVGAPYDGPVVVEDGSLWDAGGTLLARSRQIALAPRG